MSERQFNNERDVVRYELEEIQKILLLDADKVLSPRVPNDTIYGGYYCPRCQKETSMNTGIYDDLENCPHCGQAFYWGTEKIWRKTYESKNNT